MRIWLKKIRIKKGLTQAQTGILSQITPQYYNFIENGDRNPSAKVAKRIARTLGFTEWYKLLDKEEFTNVIK